MPIFNKAASPSDYVLSKTQAENNMLKTLLSQLHSENIRLKAQLEETKTAHDILKIQTASDSLKTQLENFLYPLENETPVTQTDEPIQSIQQTTGITKLTFRRE